MQFMRDRTETTQDESPKPGPHLFQRGLASVIDCKPDRPLWGDDTEPIINIVPGTVFEYLALPFLAELEAVMGVDHQTATPWSYSRARRALFESFEKRDVSFSAPLTFTQPRINSKRLAELVASPQVNGCQSPVCAVEYEGRLFIMNGHHRVAALWSCGSDTFPAYVYSIPGESRG